MLKINEKTFLNIQEAVQWLLDNNALPFQCTANYAANTEIGLGTIVNPTMAKVRIGSVIFFTDSKASTVIGVSSTGFTVSDQYIDLADDVRYISSVEIIANGLLSVTFSDGSVHNAGLIKMCTSFAIDSSQHLIAYFNDNTQVDLGAIFQGNVNISGDLTVSGDISSSGDIIATGNLIGDSVNTKALDDIAGQGYIEVNKPLRGFEQISDNNGHLRFVEGNMDMSALTALGLSAVFGKWALSGNHLMFVCAFRNVSGNPITLPDWTKIGKCSTPTLPQFIYDSLHDVSGGVLASAPLQGCSGSDVTRVLRMGAAFIEKNGGYINIVARAITGESEPSLGNYDYLRVNFDFIID